MYWKVFQTTFSDSNGTVEHFLVQWVISEKSEKVLYYFYMMQLFYWCNIDRNDMWLSSGCHYNKFISFADEPCRQEDNHGIPVLCAVNNLSTNVYIYERCGTWTDTLFPFNELWMFESSYIKMSCSISWNDFEENISEFYIRVLFFVFNEDIIISIKQFSSEDFFSFALCFVQFASVWNTDSPLFTFKWHRKIWLICL
jgi:hypothetical protein